MVAAADVLKGNTIAAGIVLKIVPATDEIWKQCLENGLIKVFKDSGAMLSNAGCAGCAAGQVGQNGPGEVTISTGNRNFPGKQGKGEVYLASPAVVAASALAGFITDPSRIGLSKVKDIEKAITQAPVTGEHTTSANATTKVVSGRSWYIREDNIDTDMIFHNRYLSITDISEMGQYAFDNLEGYENFAKEVKEGDIIVVQKNFGSGSSRQQAVDCFKALGVNCILAESYGAIYERNAINAAFPILAYDSLQDLSLENGDMLEVNYESGEIKNITKGTSIQANPFSEVQMDIFQKGGLF